MRKELLDYVADNGLVLRYVRFPRDVYQAYGVYYFDRRLNSGVILLDKDLKRDQALHNTVLGEECGHDATSPRGAVLTAYMSCGPRVVTSQDERKAVEWAADFLIPDDELARAVYKLGLRTPWELAEYFEVMEWLVREKIELLSTRTQDLVD
ncbi:MAG: hypothetical protein HPY71_01440 [Firmicutes bacterium]|nr:hypothetical protein [Bacillota bacterium]